MKSIGKAALIALLISVMLCGCAVNERDNSSRSASGTGNSGSETSKESTNSSESSSSSEKSEPESAPEPSSSSEKSEPESAPERIDPLVEELCEQMNEGGYSAGMAFVGFVDPASNDVKDCLKSSKTAEKYAFLRSAPIIDVGGDELYAVVTNKNCSAVVCPVELTENAEYDVITYDILYKIGGAEYFLLRCNISEIYSNAAVLFSSPDKDIDEFPMRSGKDGSLCVAEGVLDFTIYGDNGAEDDKNIKIATEILMESAEVSERVKQGMTLMYTEEKQVIDGRECYIFTLGTNREEQFVREYLYGVCDNLIYSYDALNDSWNVLGVG